jgi:hypothetical protein
MAFAPKWVIGSCCGTIIDRYVSENMPIMAFANRFSKSLAEKYTDTDGDKLLAISEEMMQFLVTLEDEDALILNHSYIYNTITFNPDGSKRKMKSLFSSAFVPQHSECSVDEVLRSYKAFIFALRSGTDQLAPDEWTISHVKDIDWLIDLTQQKIAITDSI